jgi:hypothetical protein
MLKRGQSISRKHRATIGLGSGHSRSSLQPVREDSSTRLTKQRSIRGYPRVLRKESNDTSLGDESGIPNSRTRRYGCRKEGSERSTRSGSGLTRTRSNGSSSLDNDDFILQGLPPRSTSRRRMTKKPSFRTTNQASFRLTRSDVDVTLNVVKLEEETPVWSRPNILRNTSRGAQLRKSGSIREGNNGLSLAQFGEETASGAFQASVDQLCTSIQEMGFVLEEVSQQNRCQPK